jgi:ABC transporter-related protein
MTNANIPIIKLEGVSRSFGRNITATEALKNLSLDIYKGEFIMIMGPSGCGKTTLLNILGLLDSNFDGSYIFDSEDIARFSKKRLARIRSKSIGFVFQSFNLIDRLNVLENVALPLTYQGVGKIKSLKKASASLKKLLLNEREYYMPWQLSGGQKQRVAIARALVNNPEIILADEPTGNLDSKASHIIMEELADLHRQGNTIIMVTHNEKLTPYASRVITMLDGRISEDIASSDYSSVDKELDNDPRVRTEKKEDVILLPKTHISKEVEEELKAEEELESKIKEQGLSEESEPISDANMPSEDEAELLEDPNLAKFLDKKKNKKRAKTKKKSKKRKK